MKTITILAAALIALTACEKTEAVKPATKQPTIVTWKRQPTVETGETSHQLSSPNRKIKVMDDIANPCDTCPIPDDVIVYDDMQYCCTTYDVDSNVTGTCWVVLPDSTDCKECLQWCWERQYGM